MPSSRVLPSRFSGAPVAVLSGAARLAAAKQPCLATTFRGEYSHFSVKHGELGSLGIFPQSLFSHPFAGIPARSTLPGNLSGASPAATRFQASAFLFGIEPHWWPLIVIGASVLAKILFLNNPEPSPKPAPPRHPPRVQFSAALQDLMAAAVGPDSDFLAKVDIWVARLKYRVETLEKMTQEKLTSANDAEILELYAEVVEFLRHVQVRAERDILFSLRAYNLDFIHWHGKILGHLERALRREGVLSWYDPQGVLIEIHLESDPEGRTREIRTPVGNKVFWNPIPGARHSVSRVDWRDSKVQADFDRVYRSDLDRFARLYVRRVLASDTVPVHFRYSIREQGNAYSISFEEDGGTLHLRTEDMIAQLASRCLAGQEFERAETSQGIEVTLPATTPAGYRRPLFNFLVERYWEDTFSLLKGVDEEVVSRFCIPLLQEMLFHLKALNEKDVAPDFARYQLDLIVPHLTRLILMSLKHELFSREARRIGDDSLEMAQLLKRLGTLLSLELEPIADASRFRANLAKVIFATEKISRGLAYQMDLNGLSVQESFQGSFTDSLDQLQAASSPVNLLDAARKLHQILAFQNILIGLKHSLPDYPKRLAQIEILTAQIQKEVAPHFEGLEVFRFQGEDGRERMLRLSGKEIPRYEIADPEDFPDSIVEQRQVSPEHPEAVNIFLEEMRRDPAVVLRAYLARIDSRRGSGAYAEIAWNDGERSWSFRRPDGSAATRSLETMAAELLRDLFSGPQLVLLELTGGERLLMLRWPENEEFIATETSLRDLFWSHYLQEGSLDEIYEDVVRNIHARVNDLTRQIAQLRAADNGDFIQGRRIQRLVRDLDLLQQWYSHNAIVFKELDSPERVVPDFFADLKIFFEALGFLGFAEEGMPRSLKDCTPYLAQVSPELENWLSDF